MAKNILVIDDQESMRSIISQALRGHGYHVLTAADGEEGLKTFNDATEQFDLILADVNMPKINGFDFLAKVKESHPEVPVLFLTGINEEVAGLVGGEHKVSGIIKKPFLVEELLSIISRTIK